MKWKLILFVFVLDTVKISYELSCKDERNNNVDWFIIYKLPKISNEPPGPLFEGKAYAYITSADPRKWKLSSHEITSEKSMLGRTWHELKEKKKSANYLFYNDDTPGNVSKVSAAGHLKGILGFDVRLGYWLMHSIPRFGKLSNYEFPVNAITNGQHAFCVTFKTSELNEISHQLLYAHPNIYSRGVNESVAATLHVSSRTLFTKKPAFRRSPPLERDTRIRSAGGVEFFSFAKDNQVPKDLFSNIIAPELKTSLVVETWRRGAGTYLPPLCDSSFDVTDVTAINMTVTVGGYKKSIYFKSTEDHSKWAISANVPRPKKKWICMADMNRMASQERRGGGALCFQSTVVWKNFMGLISETANCPVRK